MRVFGRRAAVHRVCLRSHPSESNLLLNRNFRFGVPDPDQYKPSRHPLVLRVAFLLRERVRRVRGNRGSAVPTAGSWRKLSQGGHRSTGFGPPLHAPTCPAATLPATLPISPRSEE